MTVTTLGAQVVGAGIPITDLPAFGSAVVAQGLGTNGLQGWIRDNIVPLILLGIAVIMLWIGGRGDNAGVARRGVGLLVGLVALGIAVSGNGSGGRSVPGPADHGVTRVQIRTDDDVYRVDAVWLGPPRATFPWRARYSSYGVGLIVMIVVMFFQRRLGIPIGFFSVAWALLITVVVVRFVAKRIDEDRPLLEWLTLFVHELRGPRRRTRGEGSTVGTGHVQIETARPRRALPAGRTDPHAALAVPDRTGRPAARRGPRATPAGLPTTPRWPGPAHGAPAGRGPRAAVGAAPPAAPAPPGRPRRPPVTTSGVLHVPARRADRPATTRPAAAALPSGRGPPALRAERPETPGRRRDPTRRDPTTPGARGAARRPTRRGGRRCCAGAA